MAIRASEVAPCENRMLSLFAFFQSGHCQELNKWQLRPHCDRSSSGSALISCATAAKVGSEPKMLIFAEK
ncbi:hypothetical protein [Tateyamaria pelophila]|uniref:hypothetical protein n=1 Tax=Tateyamaria pelophila TaxID=328415 RepID=UPI001CC0DEE6|nr:hypothetical protein [Tateyamaria pelophila]